jgi:hypothetical protein
VARPIEEREAAVSAVREDPHCTEGVAAIGHHNTVEVIAVPVAIHHHDREPSPGGGLDLRRDAPTRCQKQTVDIGTPQHPELLDFPVPVLITGGG